MGMAVNIAELRERGSLQNNTGSSTSGYGTREGYAEVSGLGDVRGRFRKLSGGRTNDFGSLGFDNRYEWICRYESAIENNLFKDTRWVIENRILTVDSYELIDNRKFFYRFILTERE